MAVEQISAEPAHMENVFNRSIAVLEPKATTESASCGNIFSVFARMLYGNGFREIHHHAFNRTKLDQV